jgi:hypothetical protein
VLKVTSKGELDALQRQKVKNLLVDSFPGEKTYLKKLFDSSLRDDSEKTYILCQSQSVIVGVLVLISKKIKMYNQVFSVAGMSYMAVDKDTPPSLKVTNELKREFFRLASGFDFCIGFARKILDGYWLPYGFVCASDFAQISIDSKYVPSFSKSRIDVSPLAIDEGIVRLHRLSTERGSASLIRKKSDWARIARKASATDLVARQIHVSNSLVGYFILRQNEVIELICNADWEKEVLYCLGKELLSYGKIVFNIGKSNSIIPYLRSFPHSLNVRHPWNGGHIVKINDINRCLLNLIPVFTQRVQNLNDFNVNLGKYTFSNRDRVICITNNECPDLSDHTWVKLVWGVISAHQIKEISDHSDIQTIKVLFPLESPFFLEMDHF